MPIFNRQERLSGGQTVCAKEMTKKESFAIGALYMSLSGSMLALIGFFAKLGATHFPLSTLIFFRFGVAFILGAGGVICLGKWGQLFQFANIKMQLLRTLFLLIAQYSFFYYATHNSLLNATVLLNTGPLFISVIEWAIFGQRVGKSSWIALAVSFIGVLFVLQPDGKIFSVMSLIGLLAGIGQGASQTIFGKTARAEQPYLSVIQLMLICTAASFFPYLMFGLHFSFQAKGDFEVLLGLGLGSLINQFTRVAAYNHAPPSRLAVFLYASVLVAVWLDYTFYGSKPSALSFFGAVLVVFGGVLKVILRKKFH